MPFLLPASYPMPPLKFVRWLCAIATLLSLDTLLVQQLRGADAADPSRANQQPNIVVILADDLGFGDVQANNPNRGKIKTPHIDGLAASGVRFTDAHSSSGVCSPTRYSLLTGRYHWRTRLQSGIVGVWEKPLIAAERMTIGTLAQQAGYRTACIGKWHLGWDWPIKKEQSSAFQANRNGANKVELTDEQRKIWDDVFSQPIPGGPTSRGFHEYFGTDVPNWPPYAFIANDRVQGLPTELLPAALFKNHLASLPGPALKDWKLEAILPALVEHATSFITKNAQAKQPFMLYLPLTTPHTPLAVNEAWKGKSGLGTYADLVMETDAAVGRVLKSLEDNQVAENTVVVFTSDNGCAPYIGAADLEKQGHFPSGPFRGYKASVYEGGHRVPFVARWPGVTKAGTTCQQTICSVDLLATFAEVLSQKLPDTAGEDSVSLLPLLKGEDKPIHAAVVHHSAAGVFAIRSGEWKLIFEPGGGAPGEPAMQLYDLLHQPTEDQNRAADKPELVTQLTAQTQTLIDRGRSTPGSEQKNDVPIRLVKNAASGIKKGK